MINVSSEVLNALCLSFGTTPDELTYLGGGRGDSDGIVYTFPSEQKKMVLKIMAAEVERDDMSNFIPRLEFVYYLGENGIPISYPVKQNDGSLYASCTEGKYIYTAYVMDFHEGGEVPTELLPTKFSSAWGRIIGKAHKLSKSYPVWKSLPNSQGEYGYLDERSFFTNWCPYEEGKSGWADMEKYLATLPIDRDCYGFIHNDNHQHNIIATGENITMIDFDCATCHFFLNDIITPAQGIMFDISGGMSMPVYNAEPLKRYFDFFLSGYEQENHLSDFWLGQIDMFVNYRRLLLLTCMQDYINTNAELRNGFFRMIANPPKLF